MVFTKHLIFLVLLVVATKVDLKERKIPNKLNLIGLVIGFVLATVQHRFASFILYFLILITLILLVGKVIGGGDIKLLALVPLFLERTGTYFVCLSMVYLTYFYTRKKHIKNLAFAPVILVSYLVYLIIYYMF